MIDARKKANPEILLHEQKRDIEVKKLELREALELKGLAEEEIEQRVANLEKRLREALERGDYALEYVCYRELSLGMQRTRMPEQSRKNCRKRS